MLRLINLLYFSAVNTTRCECVNGTYQKMGSHTHRTMSICHDVMEQNISITLYSCTWICLVLLILRELIQCGHSWRLHVRSKENWIECLIIIFVASYLVTFIAGNNAQGQWGLASHFGAWAVFSVWMELAMMFGQLPAIGIYIQMSINVAKTLIVFLMVYSPVLFAFAFALHLLLASNGSFGNPLTSFLKILAMMIGELDYENNFTWNAVSKSKAFVSTQILFIMFLLLVTVVIMNLLIGLTVSQVEELRLKAGVRRLKKTVEQVATTESIIMKTDAPLLKILPKQLRQALLNFGQFFSYVHRTKTNNETSPFKICFQPKYVPLGFKYLPSSVRKNAIKSMGSGKGISFGSKHVEVYLYNDCMGSMDAKTNFTLPSWIVYKTLKLLDEREKSSNTTLAELLEPDLERCKQEEMKLKGEC